MVKREGEDHLFSIKSCGYLVWHGYCSFSNVPGPSAALHSALSMNVAGKGDKENGDFENIEQNK